MIGNRTVRRGLRGKGGAATIDHEKAVFDPTKIPASARRRDFESGHGDAPKGTVNRTILKDEAPWLPDALAVEGATVWKWYGRTYGAISPNGIPVTEKLGRSPFYEIPADAVDWEF